MNPDPLARFNARLFQAARQEPPPEGAAERAVAAALREVAGDVRPRRWVRWIPALAAVLAVGTVFLVWRERPMPIAAESASDLRPARGERREPDHNAHTVLPPLPPPSVATTAPIVVTPTSLPKKGPSSPYGPPSSTPAEPSAPVTLTDELGTLSLAESALRSGDPQAALAALDRYDHVLKGQKLRAEATVLRIEALSRAGQSEAASELARRFVEEYPDGVLADRARSYLHH